MSDNPTLTLLYEGTKQNEFLHTSLEDQISLCQIDNQELECQCVINFITPFENVKNFSLMIDDVEKQFDIAGKYDDIFTFCQTFIQKLNDDQQNLFQIDELTLQRTNKIILQRQDGKQFSFQCNDYWIGKIFGCQQGIQYRDVKIAFAHTNLGIIQRNTTPRRIQQFYEKIVRGQQLQGQLTNGLFLQKELSIRNLIVLIMGQRTQT